ncbi:gephyrin-like molybdotransferase Glp [Buchananella felis]|uniref:molybdopterin molybdotransferase MoeA n=1 Tax=Buchananella felis TaxID=3231492 RepID=UPI003528ED9C
MASLSVDQHRALLADLVAPLAPQVLPVADCRGLVLAQNVEARVPVPPFTNSAMDGFALRASDLARAAPTRLPVVGDVPAGATEEVSLPPGSAVRIMTGAPVPAGADTVVKVELTDHGGLGPAPEAVTIEAGAPARANVRLQGEVVGVGATVLRRGNVLDPVGISAAVSVGYGELLVHPRPRVAVVATGSELRPPGQPLGHGQIPDSNSLLMRGLVEEAGAQVVASIVCGDDPAELRRALAACPELDLVVTAGGISAGAFEVVRQTLAGGAVFHHVAQQPGGPQGCGHVALPGGRNVPVICLPGNPVSVYVSFYAYVRGVIGCLRGEARTVLPPRTVAAVAGADWAAPAGKVQLIPVRLVGSAPSGVPLVVPVHELGSRSHLVTALPLADAIAVVPPRPAGPAGEAGVRRAGELEGAGLAGAAAAPRGQRGVSAGDRLEIIPVGWSAQPAQHPADYEEKDSDDRPHPA